MNIFSGRCGCGAVFRLPNLKACKQRCEACLGKVRAVRTEPEEWTVLDTEWNETSQRREFDLFRRGRERAIALSEQALRELFAGWPEAMRCDGAVLLMAGDKPVSARQPRPDEHNAEVRALFGTKRHQPCADGWHACVGKRYCCSTGRVVLIASDKHEAGWPVPSVSGPEELPKRFRSISGEVVETSGHELDAWHVQQRRQLAKREFDSTRDQHGMPGLYVKVAHPGLIEAGLTPPSPPPPPGTRDGQILFHAGKPHRWDAAIAAWFPVTISGGVVHG